MQANPAHQYGLSSLYYMLIGWPVGPTHPLCELRILYQMDVQTHLSVPWSYRSICFYLLHVFAQYFKDISDNHPSNYSHKHCQWLVKRIYTSFWIDWKFANSLAPFSLFSRCTQQLKFVQASCGRKFSVSTRNNFKYKLSFYFVFYGLLRPICISSNMSTC